MAENFWSFLPTHKFFFAANQKPRVSGVDEAIWRRLKLIPFNVTFPEGARDGQLLGKLLAERAGILRWCLVGCLRWRDEGLRTPSKVVEATTDYRRQEDRVAPFLEDRAGSDWTSSSPRPTCTAPTRSGARRTPRRQSSAPSASSSRRASASPSEPPRRASGEGCACGTMFT